MASPANTTRRSLFAIAGGAIIATSTAATAAAVQPSSEWDQLVAALAVIHPECAQQGRDAQAAGYHPDELTMVFNHKAGGQPFLVFRREFGENPGPRTFASNDLSAGQV